MADQIAYLLRYTKIQPTGNANEFIISMEVGFADLVSLRSQVSPLSLQFVYGTNTITKIEQAIKDFATEEGYTILDGSIYMPDFSAENNLDYLGSAALVADANATSNITIAARDFLLIHVRLVGMDITSIPALRFNGDTGNNYASRYLSVAAGGATLVNTETINTSFARLAQGNSLGARTSLVNISNLAAQSKAGTVHVYAGGYAPGLVPPLAWGGFEWSNAASPITSVQLIAVDAGSKMLAGSGFAVMGGSF